MKKKIRWKLLGSLRVHHFTSSPATTTSTSSAAVSSQSSAFILTLLLLFSLSAIPKVDTKVVKPDQNVTPNNHSQRLKSLSTELRNGTTLLSSALDDDGDGGHLHHPPKATKKLFPIDCRQLQMGQFNCPQAEIDLETQQPRGCTMDNLAPINCTLRDGLICDDEPEDAHYYAGANDSKRYVQLAVACEYTNGYSFEITLLLSIFLGFLGADRFYLGYSAIGLLKLSTLGFLFLGQFIDIILIAMQIVTPSDGSSYIIKHFGPRLNILREAGAYQLPSANATLVFDSQFNNYFYLPANYTTSP